MKVRRFEPVWGVLWAVSRQFPQLAAASPFCCCLLRGDSIVETGAAMHQPYPLVKKKIHNVHTVAQILISTQYNTHKHPAHPSTTILTPLAVGHCLVRVFVWGYSGTQGNGTWGYSGLNGSSGYAAAHKVPVWAPQRLMCLCTQCLAQLQRTGVCMSLNCRPVV